MYGLLHPLHQADNELGSDDLLGYLDVGVLDGSEWSDIHKVADHPVVLAAVVARPLIHCHLGPLGVVRGLPRGLLQVEELRDCPLDGFQVKNDENGTRVG